MDKTLLIASALAFSGAAWASPLTLHNLPVKPAAVATAAQHAASETVFSADLSSATSHDGWTTADANADGNTWAVTEGIAGITYDSDKAELNADEWLFTPGFTVTEGNDYLVSFTVRRQAAFDPDQLELWAGCGTTAADMKTRVATVNVEDNAEDRTYTYRITANDITGDMHLGFHLTSTGAQNGQFSLKSVNAVATAKCVPEAVSELRATLSHKEKTVTLTWTAPSFDTNGIAINEPISVEVAQGNSICATIDGQQPGSKGSYVASKDNFTGIATFSVTAIIGENRSKTAEVTVNLDDLQGDSILVRAFEVNRDNADEWTIEGKGQAWHYDYANIFDYNYRKGATKADEWLISPSVALETGKRYVLAYELKTSRDYGNDFEVTVGEGATAASQVRVVEKYYDLKQNGFAEYTSPQFEVETSGYYNIGFHATASKYYIDMRNLRVYYIKEKGETAINATSIAAPTVSVSVYDTTGRLIGKAASADAQKVLNTTGHGIYVVRSTSADGKTTSHKVIK